MGMITAGSSLLAMTLHAFARGCQTDRPAPLRLVVLCLSGQLHFLNDGVRAKHSRELKDWTRGT